MAHGRLASVGWRRDRRRAPAAHRRERPRDRRARPPCSAAGPASTRVLADLNRKAHRAFVGAAARDGRSTAAFAWDAEDRRDRAVVAPGHLHLGRRLRHRGHRRPARARGRAGTPRTSQRRAGHLRRPRPACATGTCCWSRPTLDEHGALVLEPLKVHAGGIVWSGPYLHVAATARGLVTCRVDDIMRVPDARGSRAWDRLGLDGRRGGVVRLPLRAAGALLLPRARRRRHRPAALLLPLPGPQRRPAGAGRRRVRPRRRRPRGWRATTSSPTP